MEIVLSIIILFMGVALVLSMAVGVAKSWAIQDLTEEVLRRIKEGADTMSLPQNINSTTYNKTELRKLLYDITELSYCADVSEVLEKIKALVI